MGWTDTHLHQFKANGQSYGIPDPDFDFSEILDERKYRLSHLMKKEKDSLIYEYDFGDGWVHKIILEKVLPFDTETVLPFCIKAKGACPPEDVGGVWGYHDLLEALADENHPEHERVRDWIGECFDPSYYDIKETNEMLSEYCR